VLVCDGIGTLSSVLGLTRWQAPMGNRLKSDLGRCAHCKRRIKLAMMARARGSFS